MQNHLPPKSSTTPKSNRSYDYSDGEIVSQTNTSLHSKGANCNGLSLRIIEHLKSLRGTAASDYVERFGDPDRVERIYIEKGEEPADARALADYLKSQWGFYASYKGLDLRRDLRDAQNGVVGGTVVINLRADGSDTPKWSSGIAELDQRCNGGLYGVVAIGGAAGRGKSIFAGSCAVANANAGRKVVIFYPEMSPNQILKRLSRAGLTPEGTRHLIVRTVYAPCDLDWIKEVSIASIEPDDESVLFVVDSINTMATVSQKRSGDYFEKLNEIARFFIDARRLTEGKVRAMLISELNKAGEIKGLQLEYSCDLAIRLSATKTKDLVKIDVTKGREGGFGELGMFLIEWQTGSIVGERCLGG